MSKERELLKNILATGWLNNTIYCSEVEKLLAQPDINTQYLLDQVARLTAENAMLKEKWLSQPEPLTPRQGLAEYKRGYAQAERDLKREPLGLEIMDVCGTEDYREGFKDGALYAEKCHGIGGGE
jgi:hypothetical protein